MSNEKQNDPLVRRGVHVQFNLLGLVAFSVSLVMATGLLAFALGRNANKSGGAAVSPVSASRNPSDKAPAEIPPWGELVAYDTQLERPEEYTAMELNRIAEPVWDFNGLQIDQVRGLMLACGLTPEQIEHACLPGVASVTASNTVIHPDDQLIFSLSADSRAKLYGELAKSGDNHYMQFPFCFPGKSFDEIANGSQMPAEIVSMIRPLLYRRGDSQYLSDFEALMRRVPSEEERERVMRALSSQSAVLARLRIRPTTDVDKLLGYWGSAPGVRFINLRPLLESLKRLENGGSVSLLYFLPNFARERLYTYPLPAQAGDPTMDCHWSTLNFFNETPDNRFADPNFTVPYLHAHYYRVAKATRYGDLIFLLDGKGNAIHSAVYIADDIVFTKNGNNYMEPWMLMRIKNLLANYSILGNSGMIVYRSKDA
jgi:hypothetical protein